MARGKKMGRYADGGMVGKPAPRGERQELLGMEKEGGEYNRYPKVKPGQRTTMPDGSAAYVGRPADGRAVMSPRDRGTPDGYAQRGDPVMDHGSPPRPFRNADGTTSYYQDKERGYARGGVVDRHGMVSRMPKGRKIVKA